MNIFHNSTSEYIEIKYEDSKYVLLKAIKLFRSAKDTETSKTVAIKKLITPFMDPKTAHRVYRELSLMKHCRHMNVSLFIAHIQWKAKKLRYFSHHFLCLIWHKMVGGPTPFFPKTHRNLDLGMGKNGEKSIWKEREKVFVLTNRCILLSLFSAF